MSPFAAPSDANHAMAFPGEPMTIIRKHRSSHALPTAVVSTIAFVIESLSLSSEPSKLYDTTHSWKPLLSPRQSYLQILDIPFSHGEPSESYLKLTNTSNDVTSVNEHILRYLPRQKMHTIRVYFAENCSDHIEGSLSKTASFAGSPAMMSQWGLSSKRIRWVTHSYRLSLAQTLKGGATIRNAKHHYIDSTSIAAGTIRRTLRCMIVSTEDGRIICEYIPPI